MNICYLSKEYPPNVVGGVGIYTHEMVHALSKLGHKVYVISEALNGRTEEYNDDGVMVFRVSSAYFPMRGFIRKVIKGTVERLEYSYAASKKLNDIVHRYDIDIVESCEARAEGFWYYMLKKSPPLIIRLHTPEAIIFKWNHTPATFDHKLMEKLEEFWILRANRRVAMNKAMVDLISSYYNLKFNNITIAPNPIDIDLFKPALSLNKFDDKFVVLYVGRLEFRKGVHILVKAIPRVLKGFPQAKFIFIGSDCGMKSYLLKKAEELRCKKNVTIIPQLPREELIAYYQKSTLSVVPSLWENFPYVCLEAMSCGKPVIASNAGGISEILKDKINGILVPPGSFLALGEAIINIFSDKQLQERLGKNARKYVEDKYAPLQVVERTLNIYQKLIDRGNY